MSESDPPDGRAVERALAGLEEALDRLLAELGRARRRAEEAETAHRGLEKKVRGSRSDGMTAAELHARLAALSSENDQLKKIIRESRTRAARIRERLRALEDDAGGG